MEQRPLQEMGYEGACVEFLLDFNRLVAEAQGDADLTTTFEPIDLGPPAMLLIAPGDSPWGKLAIQPPLSIPSSTHVNSCPRFRG